MEQNLIVVDQPKEIPSLFVFKPSIGYLSLERICCFAGCLPLTQNFRKFPDFILGNFEMVRMHSICLVPECTQLVPRVSALSPLPQALFSASNATCLCRELLCNFLEYIFLCLWPFRLRTNAVCCRAMLRSKGARRRPPTDRDVFPAAQVLANTQFRSMRSMNKKVQRRRQKNLHAKDLC